MRKGLSYHGRRNTVNNGASLAFNFLNGQGLDPRITFTRASSATFVGSNGLIQSATTNTPRFDYDPVTLAAKGLLIEEQRTNLLTYSEQFDNAAWTKTQSVVLADQSVAPDGTNSADKLRDDSTPSATHFVSQAQTTAAASYTFSVYAKKAERSHVMLYHVQSNVGAIFNLDTGVVTTPTGIPLATGFATDQNNGWWKCQITVTATAASNTFRIYLASNSTTFTYNGDGTSGIYIWGAQLEAGSFATSYVPTQASQVTRSADVASVNTLSPWYNATEGTIYVEADAFINVTNALVFNSASINDGTTSNRHRMFIYNGNWGASEMVGGVNQCDLQKSGSYTSNVQAKSAFGYKVNDFALSVNGATALTDTSGSVATSVSRLNIGGSPNDNYLNGHIRRLTYYPRRLSNAELQALTV